MLINTIEIYPLKSIPGGIEALSDFFIPKAREVLENSRNLISALLELQNITRELFEEYCKLYQVSKNGELFVPLLPPSLQAGIDINTACNPSFKVSEGFQKNVHTTRKRSIETIQGVEKNQFLPIFKSIIRIKYRIFMIRNKGEMTKTLAGFSQPENDFKELQQVFANKFCYRLHESLDTSNLFLSYYSDIVTEIEQAFWSEILLILEGGSDEKYLGSDCSPFPINRKPTPLYLPGERVLQRLIFVYRDLYLKQFLIYREVKKRNVW